MALSQDEQRVLAEIERRLAAEDPRLASSLSTFRRPGTGSLLRSPRARIVASLFTVLLVAMVSLMVYAMIPFRVHGPRAPASPSAASQTRVTISTLSATGSTNPQQATAGASGSIAGNTSGSIAGNTSGSIAGNTSGSIAGNTGTSAPNSSAVPSTRVPSPRAHGSASGQAVQATGRSAPSTHGP